MAPAIVTVHVMWPFGVKFIAVPFIFRPPTLVLVLPVISQRARLLTGAGYMEAYRLLPRFAHYLYRYAYLS